MLIYSIKARVIVLNDILFLVLGTSGFTLDIISSGIQLGRHIFYEEDLGLIKQIDEVNRERCVYGVFVLSYYERMPALIIPLILAIMGAYLIVNWDAHLE
ncbi:hypothetical protein H5410_029189 [Solanum commersonii]|uniref:Uncharacterized protein n=1 Tax=Solanum commersonii TaxID=4109 RepID=A0A9J5Z4A1_SOLCO|nr:hypothetical protein H5410_029189 [Solanum commersonii]